MKKPNTKAVAQGLAPYAMSGLLFALSWPNYPYVRLEILAWVWMVPMLLALRSVTSFPRFLRNVYFTMFLGWVLGMSWLITSTPLGTVLGFLVAGAVFTVPLLGFYLVRRSLGWQAALWSAPAVWTAWEWLYHQSEGSIGWLGMGLTQSNLYWLFQYVDITGVWGITFWVVLFNVLVVMAVEDWQSERATDTAVQSTAFRGVLALGKNPAEAGTLNACIRRLAVVAVVMLLPPLAYSTYAFINASRSTVGGREISVLMVQPNIDPWRKFDRNTRATTLGKTAALTDAALANQKPDLIIWPESALPFLFLQESAAREFVSGLVSKWQTPLLTGTLDQRAYLNLQSNPSSVQHDQNERELFNAAVLLTPEPVDVRRKVADKLSDHQQLTTASGSRTNQQFNVKISDLYHKRVLMPFVERVPFVDRFPSLSRLMIDVGAGGGFSAGNEATVFSFRDGGGEKVRVAAAICYEQLYPAQMAEFVRNGAEMLALITNEGWFSKTHGEYQMAAFTRLRSIETRRAIARTANTGVTSFIDPWGRVYGQAPWWSEQTVIGQVRLSNEMSLYVRYPDYFPKACLWLVLGLALAAIIQTAWSLVSGSRPIVQAEH